MSTDVHPKVFISHATDDKDRFVREFANKLRANGINAWVDEYEILPGDSIVEKIFEEGIKNMDAMIIVLSNVSVDRPWVREELNAGMVKKLSKSVKIIPVIIDDDCVVPESLQSTAWQRITDLQSYDKELSRIIASIFNVTQKPAIGPAPKYVQSVIDKVPGISQTDTIVFKKVCELCLENKRMGSIATKLFDELRDLDISDEDIEESLSILQNRFLIKVARVMGGMIVGIQITTRGFENYGKFFIPEYNDIISRIIVSVRNRNLRNNRDIAEYLGVNIIFIDHILDVIERRKLIKIHKFNEITMIEGLTLEGERFVRAL